MLERDFWKAKIKERVDRLNDLRTLRMLWGFVKNLDRNDEEGE